MSLTSFILICWAFLIPQNKIKLDHLLCLFLSFALARLSNPPLFLCFVKVYIYTYIWLQLFELFAHSLVIDFFLILSTVFLCPLLIGVGMGRLVFFFLMNLSILCGIIHIPINLLLKCLIQCFLFELPRWTVLLIHNRIPVLHYCVWI